MLIPITGAGGNPVVTTEDYCWAAIPDTSGTYTSTRDSWYQSGSTVTLKANNVTEYSGALSGLPTDSQGRYYYETSIARWTRFTESDETGYWIITEGELGAEPNVTTAPEYVSVYFFGGTGAGSDAFWDYVKFYVYSSLGTRVVGDSAMPEGTLNTTYTRIRMPVGVNIRINLDGYYSEYEYFSNLTRLRIGSYTGSIVVSWNGAAQFQIPNATNDPLYLSINSYFEDLI